MKEEVSGLTHRARGEEAQKTRVKLKEVRGGRVVLVDGVGKRDQTTVQLSTSCPFVSALLSD